MPERDRATLHPGAHDMFHGSLYMLDLLMPVINLKQRDAWTVHCGYEWCAATCSAVGWLAATIIAAGLAGVFKRDCAGSVGGWCERVVAEGAEDGGGGEGGSGGADLLAADAYAREEVAVAGAEGSSGPEELLRRRQAVSTATAFM